MEKTHREKQAPKPQAAKPLVWDCGSTLYDSFELKSFERQLDSAINSRSFSMPHVADRRPIVGVAPLVPVAPPPPVSNKPSKISRSLLKFFKSVFKSKQNGSRVLRIHEGHRDEYYVVYDKSAGLTTIPEVPEFDFGGFSPEINSLVKKSTASARFSAASIARSGLYKRQHRKAEDQKDQWLQAMDKSCTKVCVTGGSGYIASTLVKKLLKKGYIVHVTLRNLEDKSKVGLLLSLPEADTKVVLFQADMYKPHEFEAAIEGCEFVFHVATPLQHEPPEGTLFKDRIEATIAALKSIADSCIRSQTVRRLIYTGSVMACSPLSEHGTGFKSLLNESCWTPLNLSFTHCNDFTLEYTIAKTLAEKEGLSYNEIDGTKLEVVSLACGLVGGETLLSSLPLSVLVILSQVTGNPIGIGELRFIEELLGSVPLVHVDDVCEAHIFAMENPSMKGRFLCATTYPTVREMANYYEENYSDIKIDEKFKGGVEKGIPCDSWKLVDMGFQYKYDMKKIIHESLECGKRLGALPH